MKITDLWLFEAADVPDEPAGAPTAAPAGAPQRQPESSELRALLQSLRARWPIGLASAAVLAALGGTVLWKRGAPSYRAEAVLYVDPVAPNLAYTGDEWRAESIVSFYGDYVRTLKAMAVQRSVLEDAIAELEADAVAWRPAGVPPEEAPDHLRARLDVSYVRDSYLLSIAIDDVDAQIPAPLVNTVTEKFLANLAANESESALQRLGTLRTERDRIEAQLATNQAELDQLSESTGIAVLDERQNVFYERLVRLQDGANKVVVDRVRAEGDLFVQAGRAEELREQVPEGSVLALIDQDTAVRDARVMLQRLVRDVETDTGDLSDEHPTRLQALARIDAARERLNELLVKTRTRVVARVMKQRDEQAFELQGNAQRRLDAARRAEENMGELVADAEARLAEYGRSVQRGKVLHAASDRLLRALDRVDSRIEELLVESKAPGRVHWRSRAIRPFRPVKDRRVMLIAAALFASLAAGCAIAVLTERIARAQRRTLAVELAVS